MSASPLCRGGLVTVGGSGCTSNKLSVSIEKKKEANLI